MSGRHVGMMGAMEATARLEAESALLKKHDAEYNRLSAKLGHAAAVVKLVTNHKREYDALVKVARDKVPARIEAAAAAASSAA
jgi:hypothetical protein